MITFGKFQINPAGLDGMTRSDFDKMFKGKISVDIDMVWAEVMKYRKANRKAKK